MAILTVEQVREKVREGSKVLWEYRGNVEDGSVSTRVGDELDLCWLDGYKSRNDTIAVGDVLAILDKRAGRIEVFPFSGPGFLTEAGKRWVDTHPNGSPL